MSSRLPETWFWISDEKVQAGNKPENPWQRRMRQDGRIVKSALRTAAEPEEQLAWDSAWEKCQCLKQARYRGRKDGDKEAQFNKRGGHRNATRPRKARRSLGRAPLERAVRRPSVTSARTRRHALRDDSAVHAGRNTRIFGNTLVNKNWEKETKFAT